MDPAGSHVIRHLKVPESITILQILPHLPNSYSIEHPPTYPRSQERCTRAYVHREHQPHAGSDARRQLPPSVLPSTCAGDLPTAPAPETRR